MQVDEGTLKYFKNTLGLEPLPTHIGLKAFEELLAYSEYQGAVVYGNKSKMHDFLSLWTTAQERRRLMKAGPVVASASVEDAALLTKAEAYLRRKLADVLKLPIERLEPNIPFERYGMDSILVMDLTRQLEQDFDVLPKTLFFEYKTLAELAGYFVREHEESLKQKFAASSVALTDSPFASVFSKPAIPTLASFLPPKRLPEERLRFTHNHSASQPTANDIAVIGLAGRYPMAKDLDKFWDNLKAGKDCVSEIPLERWDWRKDYAPNKGAAGKVYAKWGSFVEDIDKFDPSFFNITPKEAELMDPQERLFLQMAWEALEDAGYTPESLQQSACISSETTDPAQVGVFVGVMYGLYQLYGAENTFSGQPMALNSSYASIANRVSFYLNLQGPSLAVDTMCSSSLTALHLACESLRRGECQVALAGGVNLHVHPNKYLLLSQGHFLASDGKCKSFGEGSDGYVPGEGVGAVLLKPLAQALQDQDIIYGVIKSSSINHGGRANGYTVPNPVAQANVIKQAFQQAEIEPQSLTYLEAHGTGTSLGDPIEIRGLARAFGEKITKQSIPIGSVKSNIGHLESAAGIVALTKVLLQMRHKQLVPSLHAETLNPHIVFSETPFYVQRALSEWKTLPNMPRRAGISSFGAGGSNAHVIVEEAPEQYVAKQPGKPYYLITLSAKHPEALHKKVQDLQAWLERYPATSLEAISYTLNTGRSHFQYRLALVAPGTEELRNTLETFYKQGKTREVYQGDAQQEPEDAAIYQQVLESTLKELQNPAVINAKQYQAKLAALANLYVRGYDIDWALLHQGEAHQKLSLPTYPFLQKRYWVENTDSQAGAPSIAFSQMAVLHPLIDSNESSFMEQVFKKDLRPEAYYLRDHLVNDQIWLPGTGYLEMAQAAGSLAAKMPVSVIQEVLWLRPIALQDKPLTVWISLNPYNTEQGWSSTFAIWSTSATGERLVHCEGRLGYGAPALEHVSLDLLAIRARCSQVVEPDQIYSRFKAFGFDYRTAFQTSQRFYLNDEEILQELTLPAAIHETGTHYILHPCLMDGALRSLLGHYLAVDAEAPLQVPFSLEKLVIVKPVQGLCYAYTRFHKNKIFQDMSKADITICDENGDILVFVQGFQPRAVQNPNVTRLKDNLQSIDSEICLYQPTWFEEPLESACD